MNAAQLQKNREYRRRVAALLAQVKGLLRPTQIEEIEGFLSQGDVRLALEFCVDFLLENQQPLTHQIVDQAVGLVADLRSDRGAEFLRKLVPTGADLPRYYTVNDRPIKQVATADGGMDELVLNMRTGEFERDIGFLSQRRSASADIDSLTAQAFDARVAAIRQDLAHKQTAKSE